MNTTETLLRDVAVRTFEELCFMFPDPEAGDEYPPDPPEASVGVTFRSPLYGRLTVEAYEGLLPALASNMLGEEHASQQQQLDALGEIANVICGNVLPSFTDATTLLRIDAPTIQEVTSEQTDASTCLHSRVILHLDQGAAVICMYVAAHQPVLTGDPT